MEYRAVGNRCAVDISQLQLPVRNDAVFALLLQQGFKLLEVDIVAVARSRIGKSTYRRSARPSEAPGTIDCSSFVKWLYGERGIWLPRRTIQQRELGEPIEYDKVGGGDAVFVSGRINYYASDRGEGVGHVGIATGDKTVVHAVSEKLGVIESPLDVFVGNNKLRGIRRYIPKNRKVITLETPPEREVETADDIKWIIIQSL